MSPPAEGLFPTADTSAKCQIKTCWALFTEPLTGQAAKARCLALGLHDGERYGQTDLVSPATLWLHSKLANWLLEKRVNEAWIGLTTDRDINPSTNPEDWYWSNPLVKKGKTPSYDAWPPEDKNGVRPYPSSLYSNCVSIEVSNPRDPRVWTWQNNWCGVLRRAYVCEITYNDALGSQPKRRRP